MLQKLINFSHYSSIKIGIPKIVNIIQTPKDYYSLLQNSTPQIIGKANNLLISPEAKNLILLDDDFDYIKDYENYLEVGGLTPSRKLFTYAKKNNLKGFEILGGIPGSIGGIIKMNAGLKNHEIKSTLLGILSIQDSHVLEFTPTQALKLELSLIHISEPTRLGMI